MVAPRATANQDFGCPTLILVFRRTDNHLFWKLYQLHYIAGLGYVSLPWKMRQNPLKILDWYNFIQTSDMLFYTFSNYSKWNDYFKIKPIRPNLLCIAFE